MAGKRPLNGYIQQGAFADAAGDGALLIGDVDPSARAFSLGGTNAGIPYFYSLDTYVRTNVLIDDAANHIKRVEVIRPGGNAVVFDFAWNSSTGTYSSLGYPMGWNSRDSQRTYVLRALDPSNPASLKYALEFADGTVQTFNQTLQTVSTPDGLTAAVSSSLTGGVDTGDSSFGYSITINSSNGRITSIDYHTKPTTGSQAISTTLSYSNTNLFSGLTKTGGGYAMPEFGYSLSGTTISTFGADITRTGPSSASVANSTVAIRVTPEGTGIATGTYSEEDYQFNADSLVTLDESILAPGDSEPVQDIIAAQYTYYTGSRSSVNGYAPWGKVKQVTTPGGGWTVYQYFDGSDSGPATGWVKEVVTPFINGGPTAPTNNVEHKFTYDVITGTNGQGADPMALVERPRKELDYVKGTFAGGSMSNYIGPTTVVTRKLPLAGSAWSSGVFETTVSAPDYRDSTVSGMGMVSSIAAAAGSIAGQTVFTSLESYGGATLSQEVETDNAFDQPVSDEQKAVGAVYVNDAFGSPDAFGNSTTETASGGAHAGATYDRSVTWFGPVSVAESDGSTTKYTYTPMGQVATKVIYSGTGHAVKYAWEYDAAGNAVSVTTTAVDSSGAPVSGMPVVKNVYVLHDSLGRLIDEIDNSRGQRQDTVGSRETYYDYEDGQRTETVLLPRRLDRDDHAEPGWEPDQRPGDGGDAEHGE